MSQPPYPEFDPSQVEDMLEPGSWAEQQVLNESLEVGKPFWWARSTLAQRKAALRYTVTFTEWVIQVWNLERKLLPPCWVLHPDIVVEMHALALAHSVMYRHDNPNGPVQWLLYLDYQRRRLAENNAAAGCASRRYHERIDQGHEPVLERLRSYGEGDAGNPELPLALGHWTWPHTHPEQQQPEADASPTQEVA